jgi:hypothetical protein
MVIDNALYVINSVVIILCIEMRKDKIRGVLIVMFLFDVLPIKSSLN